MAQLKRLADGYVVTVASQPKEVTDGWDCGDQVIADPGHSLYEVVSTLLTPVQFHNAFSVTERIKIKASTDPIVKEFWNTFELAASQPGETIDTSSAAVVGGLAYIAGATSAPQPVIAAGDLVLASPARIAQIQAGTPGGF